MTGKDYEFVEEYADGDLWFTQTLFGEDAKVVAFFNPKGELAKWLIDLVTADKDAIDTYEEVADRLRKKYGKPDRDVEIYRDPYYKGDGYEEQAIEMGKATIGSLWNAPSSDEALWVQINENLTVGINYESDGWAAEAERRASEDAADF